MLQNKKDFLNKIVKKDHNIKLEEILEKKAFDEDVKNMLLNIFYKLDAGYKDYAKIKGNIQHKEEFIENLMGIIVNKCNIIKFVKINSEESKILGKKTFLLDAKRKSIIVYPIERKLLYCISKIDKNPIIVKSDYKILEQAISSLINIGNNINTVEPIRDYNGYSWMTVASEIESIEHNLIYQNLRILLGNKFLENWVKNTEFIIDYVQSMQNKLEEKYGNKNSNKIMKIVQTMSIILLVKYDENIRKNLQIDKREIERTILKLDDKEKYIEEISIKKRKLAKEIKKLDEIINNSIALNKEYEKRNEKLPLTEKIFSVRFLLKDLKEEREEKIRSLEVLNGLLNPKKFVVYKKELEDKYKYYKLIELYSDEEKIQEYMIELQKVFLNCYSIRIKLAQNKQEVDDLIREFRYYAQVPFDRSIKIIQNTKIEKEFTKIVQQLISKAEETKKINKVTKDEFLEYKIFENLFNTRISDLSEINFKIIKEKDNILHKEKDKKKKKEKYYIQLFDENVFEDNIELKDLTEEQIKSIKKILNKKIKILN